MTNATARAAHLMTFTAKGEHAGSFTVRTRADWRRDWREARERAGTGGSVFLYAASVRPLTGKLVSVAATPSIVR